jgi:hypothetical protein
MVADGDLTVPNIMESMMAGNMRSAIDNGSNACMDETIPGLGSGSSCWSQVNLGVPFFPDTVGAVGKCRFHVTNMDDGTIAVSNSFNCSRSVDANDAVHSRHIDARPIGAGSRLVSSTTLLQLFFNLG